jgi:hypothetical protein
MNNELKLWKFDICFGRAGNIAGLFIATEKEVDFLIGNNIDFGEALGKHSEVHHQFTKEDLETLNVSNSTVQELLKAVGTRYISGNSPFEYIYAKVICTKCRNEEYEDISYLINGNCAICGNNTYEIVEHYE